MTELSVSAITMQQCMVLRGSASWSRRFCDDRCTSLCLARFDTRGIWIQRLCRAGYAISTSDS